MLEFLFWTCAFAALHHHLLYPLSLILVSRRRPVKPRLPGDLPVVRALEPLLGS